MLVIAWTCAMSPCSFWYLTSEDNVKTFCWKFLVKEFSLDIRHANSFFSLERGCTWLLVGFIRRFLLELNTDETSINSFNSSLYYDCVGGFRTITNVLLSDITFYSTFPKITNGGKAKKFSQRKENAFTCKAARSCG